MLYLPETDITVDDIPVPMDISIDELVKLGAVDNEFFCRTFFPKTYRQSSPAFHRRIDTVLESPQHRLINLQCYRGSAKTTKLRTFAAKRIAYRMSRTILVIGASEPAASRTIQWLRGQIERNKLFASAFGLRPGKKWHETEIEIISDVDGSTTWVLGVGVTSNLRGINFDDYRPDLIIGDDLLTDENVLTKDSREKITDLVLGAVVKSLAPQSEEPNAKLALLQTPLHDDDVSMIAARSEMWHTERFSCWTPETEDNPDDQQISAWEDRFPTAEVRKDKRSHIQMGKAHIFNREMEVRLTSPATASFNADRLQFYKDGDIKGKGTSILFIDPVPPPSDLEVEKNLKDKNYEAIGVITRSQGNYYLRHYELMRGHDPSWTIAKTFEMAIKYQVSYIAVDATAYQMVLKWLLETAMKRRQQYYVVIPDKGGGRKSKYQKIVDALGSLLPYGKFYCKKEHTEFIAHLTAYPKVQFDDLLDGVAIGLRSLINPAVELGEGEYTSSIDESEYEDLGPVGRSP